MTKGRNVLYELSYLIAFLLPVIASAQEAPVTADLKIAGHRGGYYYNYPESSLSLFAFIATEFDPDTIIVEIDLRKSKDGTIYLMHDATVDRTSNGRGNLEQLTDSYINSLFLKKETGELTREHIPTFEQMLSFSKGKNINLMLDIKSPIHAEAYALVKKHHMESRMLTLTFNTDLTRLAAALSNAIALSALIESEEDLILFKQIKLPMNKKVAYINSNTPPGLIKELKQEKIQVMADVNEAIRNSRKPLEKEGYKRKVTESSLDILITDFPVEARKAFKMPD